MTIDIKSYIDLWKLRVGLKVEPEPVDRVAGLYQYEKFIVIVPTVVGVKNNFRVDSYERAIQLDVSASAERIGKSVVEVLNSCRIDRSLNWWSGKPDFASSELQRLTGCKRKTSFFKYVKYVQISETEGIVVFNSTIAGEIFTSTPKFEASISDIQKLGESALLALQQTKTEKPSKK